MIIMDLQPEGGKKPNREASLVTGVRAHEVIYGGSINNMTSGTTRCSMWGSERWEPAEQQDIFDPVAPTENCMHSRDGLFSGLAL